MRCFGSVVRAESEEVVTTRPRTIAGEAADGRIFYEELLGGRQVWPTGRRAGFGRLWFLFGETLVEAGPMLGESRGMIEVEVDSPNDTAARCWDAGYTVRPLKNGTPGALSVIDPFGRQVVLLTARRAYDAGEAG